MFNEEVKSVLQLLQAFPDEQSCILHLEALRWNGVVISPFDVSSKVYKCKGNNYRCKNTGKYFNVKTGTMFDNTKLPLQKWFLAIWLVTCHKKGISSYGLAEDIDVTQKSAWFMLQRIRACFGSENNNDLDGIVEVDETFVGGKNKNRHKAKKVPMCQGRSFKDKTPVLGMLQRGGKLTCVVVPDTKGKTIQPLIKKFVKPLTRLISDEWWAYQGLNAMYNHAIVNHGAKQYVNMDDNTIHSNSIEGFWGIFKRGMIGVYNWVMRKHLQKYVDEFVFRFNTRLLDSYGRFNTLLRNMENRLTYKQLING